MANDILIDAGASRAISQDLKLKEVRMAMLVVFFVAAFVAAYNEIIINVALLDIMTAFAIDSVTAQWLVTGYMIVTVVVVASVAFLSQRFSLRALFFAGGSFFVVGSIAAMLAPTFAVLVVCRLVQAVGSGIFIPTMMSVVMAVAPREKLGTFFSIGSSCIVLGPAFGPVIAGVMVTVAGWRSIFLPGCVVIAVLMVVGAVVVRNVGERRAVRLDALSVVLMVVGLVACSYGLTQLTYQLGVALACLVVGGVAVALFARRQGRLDGPMLNMRPLARWRFSVACLLVVVAMMTTFSMSVLLPLYFEGALGFSAMASGLLMLIPILVNALTALVGGRILDRWGTWPLLPVGFAVIAAGQVAVCVAGGWGQLAPLVAAATVVYAGVGPVFAPSQTAGLRSLAPEENAHGVALVNVFIQLAGCIGPSLFVGVLSSSMAREVASGVSETMALRAGFVDAVALAAAIALVGLAFAFAYARTGRKRA